jgi:hypothetical protein
VGFDLIASNFEAGTLPLEPYLHPSKFLDLTSYYMQEVFSRGTADRNVKNKIQGFLF